MSIKKPFITIAICAYSLFFGAVALAVDLEWHVFTPSFGEIFLGKLRIEVISSPFVQKDGVCSTEEHQETCEAIFSRQWLRIIPVNQPRAVIIVGEVLAPTEFVHDYSLLISSGDGTLRMANGRNIRFAYYTINADASEAANIEKHRVWLDDMARQKKKIRLSGTISRIETSDTTLFTESKTETEFLDFYLSDIQFEK